MSDILGFIQIGLLLTALTAVLYLPIYFALRKQISLPKQLAFLLFGASCVIILFATVLLYALSGDLTFSPPYYFLNLIPFQWLFVPWEMGTNKMLIQVVSNILLFIPFGFFFAIVFRKRRSFRKALPVFVCIPLCIETFQYFTGRSADIDDVLQNLLGAILGYAIFRLFSRFLQGRAWWEKALGERPKGEENRKS